MKALYTDKPGKMGLVERPRPALTANDALVRVVRAGLCHTDLVIKQGQLVNAKYPFIPGHEFSGVVEECGSAIDYISPGDRVAVQHIMSCGHCPACRKGDTHACESVHDIGIEGDGGFAEFCSVPARHLYRIPDHVSFDEAALAEPLANAVSVVKAAHIQHSDRVVIIGPGPIGLLTAQVAALKTPQLLALLGTRDSRLEIGKRLGPTHTINTTRDQDLRVLSDLFDGRGANVIVECAGNSRAFKLATDLVGWKGRIIVEGIYEPGDTIQIEPYTLLLLKSVSVIGINGWSSSDFTEAIELLSQGRIDAEAIITHTFPLAQWKSAFEMIENHKDEAIKVLLAMQ